jgi:two-component system, NtrC family, C4-dicarboxylate transport response regulator DctD
MLFAQTWAIGLPLPYKDAQSAVDGRPLALTVAAFEQTVIENALRAVGGNVLRLEQLLGTPRKTLYDKLNRYRLRPKNFSQASASARTDPRVCR